MSSADALLASLPDAVLLVGAEGTILEVAGRVDELAGWVAGPLVGRSIEVLLPNGTGRHLVAELRRWEAGGSSALERRLLRLQLATPDGGVAPVGVRVHRGPTGFTLTVRRLDPGVGDLRSTLLDAVSTTDVTSSDLAAAADAAGRAYDWDLAAVWAIDATTATLRAVSVWEREPDPERRHRSATLRQPFLVGEGLPGEAWQQGEVVVVSDVSGDPRFAGGDGSQRRPQSGALIPLRAGRRVVGVLELLSFATIDPRLWLASEAEAVSTGFGQLVERFGARLQAEAAEGRLALALDAGELGFWTLDVRSGRAEWSARMAELHAVDGTEGGADSLFANVAAEDRVGVGHALERARRSDETQTVEYRVEDADRGTSWLSTRLTRIHTHGGPPLLSAVSSEITDRKRAELSAQRRRAAVEGLQWVSQAIIAGRQLTDTAVAVAHAATGVLGADVGIVLYPEPTEVGSELAWAISGLPGEEGLDLPAHLEIEAVARTATGVELVPDMRRAPDIQGFVESLGLPLDPSRVRSALLVPVGGERGRPLGLMLFLSEDRRYFTDDDARLAASIGSSTGVAIENAHRHEEQRLAATAFQRQLLPPSDIELPGVELCGRYHPGRDGLEVGGDWYDVFRLDDHRVGLAVGDVCGHGLTAAAHMGQFRHSFRALVQSSSPPEEALRVLNRLALEELHTTATIAYAELDTRTGACTLWSCGHLPPIVTDHRGDVRWLSGERTGGPMLGFLPQLEVVPHRTELAVDASLFLYTDGLVERPGESIDVGLERLHEALARSAAEGLESICDELYAVVAHTRPDSDDTVILGVRRR